ncbi:Subtilisin-like protease SBT5.3, partial [Bienertia sinuspersici]
HYIVYLGSHDGGCRLQGDPNDVTKSHHEMISSVSKKRNNNNVLEDLSKKLIYSYTKVFNGFAATLDEEEAEELAKHPNVISIFENRQIKQHTTHSWDFLRTYQHQNIPINESIWEKANFGEDMIIGGLDTGKCKVIFISVVFGRNESFSDEGFGPVPSKFKGQCDNEKDPTFKCNRKVVGARFFYKGLEEVLSELFNKRFPANMTRSARDMGGHGTHTLSTAAGNSVVPRYEENVYLRKLGLKKETPVTVKGGAPRARVAVYKVVWPESNIDGTTMDSTTMDAMAAMEAAIVDGVDVINLSMGTAVNNTNLPTDTFYLDEAIAIGSFHAMSNGILVVASAGNVGPSPSIMANLPLGCLLVALLPPIGFFPVGTRYIDYKINNTYYPLVFGGDARSNSADVANASYCMQGSVDPMKGRKEHSRKEAGAVGLILANDQVAGSKYLPDNLQSLPTVQRQLQRWSSNSFLYQLVLVLSSSSSSSSGTGSCYSEFSSRGPNLISPDILKPDVIAPALVLSLLTLKLLLLTCPMPNIFLFLALLSSPLDTDERPILEDDLVSKATPLLMALALYNPTWQWTLA